MIRPLIRSVSAAPDPLTLYAALTGGGRRQGSFLLESADGGAGSGERSILGLSWALRIACHGRKVTIEAGTPNGRSLLPWLGRSLRDRAEIVSHGGLIHLRFPPSIPDPRLEPGGGRRPGPLDAIRAAVTGVQALDEPDEDTYLAAGCFSYDLVELFEELPPGAPEPFSTPHFELFVPDRLVIVDHRHGRAVVAAHAFGGRGAEANLHDAARAVRELTEAVSSAPPAAAPPAHPAVPGSPASAGADLSDAEFAGLVGRLRSHLERGEVYQIVPSRTFLAQCGDPLAAYARLRAADPSPYLFFVHARNHVLLGASPETAVRVDGASRRVTLRPIAGTAARGRRADGSLDPDLDSRREAALHLDPKETAEHLMLVDLARNDVARISRPGSRRVTRLMEVERYAHVMHLVSEVQGELRQELDALDAYVAAMNPGTLVGAPKHRAAAILREVEASRRGVYGGAVGLLTGRGAMDTAIAIRAASVREGVARVRAGAGVVLGSVPEREAEETRRKASAVLRALPAPEAVHG